MKYLILFLALIFSNAMFAPAMFAQGGTKSPVDIFLKNTKKKPVEDEKKPPAEPEKKIFSTVNISDSAKSNSSSACRMTIV